MILVFNAGAQSSLRHSDVLSYPSLTLYFQEARSKGLVEAIAGKTHVTALPTRAWSGGVDYARPISGKSAILFGLGEGVLASNIYLKEYEYGNTQTIFQGFFSYAKLSFGMSTAF